MNEIKRQGTSSLIRVNDLITAFVKSQYSCHLLMKRNHIVRGKVSIIHHMIW